MYDLARFEHPLPFGEPAGEFRADDRDCPRVTGFAQPPRDRFGLVHSRARALLDHPAALEDVLVAGQLGFVHQDLLGAEAEQLFGLIGQGQRFAKAGQLQRIDAGAGRDQHRQRLVGDPDYVEFRLLFGERQRPHLTSGPKQHPLDPVLFAANLRPQLEVGANLTNLWYQLDPAVDEERDALDGLLEGGWREFAAQRVENQHRVAEGVTDFLLRSGAAFHVVIAAAVDRVPVGNSLDGELDELGRKAQ